ncbi:Uncharacterised protein [Porphyromonas macacae]|uniref:Uncharacterized protein n=1 Tax=Porphyromonas macacae TaxID=28115 RepID=A0A379E6T1_9PORP|nr:Uncharacterised protein [Porphyromonas macacae]
MDDNRSLFVVLFRFRDFSFHNSVIKTINENEILNRLHNLSTILDLSKKRSGPVSYNYVFGNIGNGCLLGIHKYSCVTNHFWSFGI